MGVVGENGRNWVTHISHDLLCQDVLPALLQLLHRAAGPQVNGRDVGHIGTGPDRVDAGKVRGGFGVDGCDPTMGDSGAHDTHVKLPIEILVTREPAGAGQQCAILQPGNALSDKGHGAAPSRTPRTARRMFR